MLDLGCYAGGWSQVAVQRTAGREALVVGVAAGIAHLRSRVLGSEWCGGDPHSVSRTRFSWSPLEGHYFVQGDIEDVGTVRQVEE